MYPLAPLLLVVWVANIFVASSPTAAQNIQNNDASRREIKPDSTVGKRTFASTCASCHGLDGKGSERAPNIADRPSVQRLSDSQIFHIIENGLPGTGMPAFRALDNVQIKNVVAYLRTLQGARKAVKLPGDPEHGKALFFGKAGCSQCHMVAGEGGFIASDLSEYARIHEVEQMRSAILEPAASNNRQARLVTATVRGGKKYVGRVRNEDNFSLQVQTLDGAFHFMSKSDLESLEYDAQTLMPSDYSSRLSAAELNELISYLITAAGAADSKVPKKANEWDD